LLPACHIASMGVLALITELEHGTARTYRRCSAQSRLTPPRRAEERSRLETQVITKEPREMTTMRWHYKLNRPHATATASDARQLVAAAESFLAGRYEEYLRENHELIPGWTRLNGVAHGDLETLKDMVQSLNIRELRMVAEHSDKAWRVAQEVIAAELVQLVMDNTQLLARIQQRVLVPLEFCLMDEEELAPLELVVLTRAALRSRTT
jgi:hypothetical protein